jgi:non-canonical purine NTP pyrophosphatase (RdgB/HAM1 family)
VKEVRLVHRINYATTNQGKVLSLQRTLKPYGIEVVQSRIDLPEPRSDDLRDIAGAKVLEAYGKLGEPVVALDAGFFMDGWNGFPAAYVNHALERLGIEGILALAAAAESRGRPRTAAFRHCLAYFDKKLAEPVFFENAVQGWLTHETRGRYDRQETPWLWSEIATIFKPHGVRKTLAEMTREEYETWKSEREEAGSYGHQFAEWYLKNRMA